MGGRIIQPHLYDTQRDTRRGKKTVPTPPINRLPPEILAELFVSCAAVHPYAPATISRVCKRWRDIVSDWPRVWYHLFLDEEERGIRSLQRQCELWAAHSSPLTFDVEINMAHVDVMLAVLSPLIPHIARWRSFKVQGNWIEHIQMSNIPGRTEDEPLALERIDIFIDEDMKDEVARAPFRPTRDTFQFIEGQFSMQLYMSTLPERYFLEPMQVTTLIIQDNSDVIHPVKLLKLLTAFPQLQTLRVAGWPQTEMYDYTSAPVVSLPHLVELALRGLLSTRALLSHLHAPSLRELNLGLLNVDHRLSDEFDYESGDSEDEAQDYSQSPSSDHATGMGLRSLIRRCNPPLELLYMDYADMRTKDFQWCFDRLPKLQIFGIVASDMSDNVIRLLAPYRESDEGEGVEMRLRLPSLKTLVLRNCQRLSGEAVVDTLRSRVQYTDQPRWKVTLSTLQHVQIANCDGVRDPYIQTLRDILGPRLTP
ncbi:hypothetical protein GLOTRDRAFT_77128 [Gloeophyllum trabeum ATCC 11539]|uniref:F-box domain-containing protein n=1 Tax=Gloeophyllum trabeum (strain ATCC 11539 / FP-39264 / Madison 617) TaxID=670483 RepID=S7RJM3_GLOTA|nr:uncharacterized protein GLOTRDRAFT_77128 [Gloeophyllum trabeum ATCC 11539]EPQ54540.1 hypothetical protein GLOTRDRAFT_77128 [Gloeophyllum trabeum ATCC 11539]